MLGLKLIHASKRVLEERIRNGSHTFHSLARHWVTVVFWNVVESPRRAEIQQGYVECVRLDARLLSAAGIDDHPPRRV